jgi:hypothetical protein
MKNSKSEIRNPKQIRIPKSEIPNAANGGLGFSDWSFEFVSDFGFRISSLFARLLLLSTLPWLTGCIEIDRTIKLNVDGSGQIVEAVRFDDRLVQAAKSSRKPGQLLDFLDEKYLRERLPLYGEVTLVSHEVKDLGGKGKQAISILAFKDINKVTLPALPHRGANWTDQKLTFQLGKEHEFQPFPLGAKTIRKPLRVDFAPATKATEGVNLSPTPVLRQELVRLLPVLRPMAAGFRMRLTLEAFGPIWKEVRNTHVFYDVTADDLDDETLLKILEWNSAPDQQLAQARVAGTLFLAGRKGRVMVSGYTLEIAPPKMTR